jgi:inactive STAND
MDKFRAVQLRNNINNQVASGYLVRNNLILTAHHLFRDSGCTLCNVRFLEDTDELQKIGWNNDGCELVWCDAEQDMALLQLICDLPVCVANSVQDFSVPRFGKFENREIEGKNMGCGFVNYQDELGFGCSKDFVLSGRMRRSIQTREIELYLEQSLVPSTSTAWQGISGTAFFANGYLVGVTKKTDGFLGEKALCAINISQVYENPGFCRYVFAGEDKPLLSCVTEALPVHESINYSSQDLDNLLLALNYSNQQKQITDAISGSNLSQIFLLPQNGRYAQKWLVKRLSRNVTNYNRAKKFELRADSSWNDNDLIHFWIEWENNLGVDGQNEIMAKLGKLCDPKQPLIITIHDIDEIHLNTLDRILQIFWRALIGGEHRHRCILFLTRKSLTEINLQSQIEIEEWTLVTNEEIVAWVESQEVEDFLVRRSNRKFDPSTLYPLSLPQQPDSILKQLWGICNLNIQDHFCNYNS